MKLSEVIQIVNGISNVEYHDCDIKKIKTDSREIESGDVFLGINSGYLFIDDAINNGALGVIVAKDIEREDILIIKVEDSIEAMKALAIYYRNQYSKPVIAITGSVGKTTTKELIAYTLSTNRKVLKNEGNKNNILGVTNTLLALDNSYDCVVLEVGMNHAMEIHHMSMILKPTICIITAIGTAHIGNLGSIENILKAKMEIIDGNEHALLLLNGENSYLQNINGVKCKADEFPYKALFKHLQMNYNLAIKTCILMGMDYEDIVSCLDDAPLYNQRMNIIRRNGKTIIDDSYNASYESIVGGLDYLNGLNGRKIIILGEILELGEFSLNIHENLIKSIESVEDSICFFVGRAFQKISFGTHFATTDELLEYLKNYPFLEGDVIYIKASRAWKFDTVVDLFLKDIS